MSRYQAQWISKDRICTLRKSGGLTDSILLDSFKGFIIIQPSVAQHGDGELLSPDAADYELRPEWCPGSVPKLREARKRLQLDGDYPEANAASAASSQRSPEGGRERISPRADW